MYDSHPSQPENVAGLIYTNCKSPCPETCINNGTWAYYDGSDENNEWLTDSSLRLSCPEGKGCI